MNVLNYFQDRGLQGKFKGAKLDSLDRKHSFLNELYSRKRTRSGEYLYLMSLDENKQLQKIDLLNYSVGGEVKISIPDYVDKIVNSRFSHFLLTHNHPNNTTTPSNEDILFTNYTVRLCTKLDKKLLDHVIWTKEQVFSFEEQGIEGTTNSKDSWSILLNND